MEPAESNKLRLRLWKGETDYVDDSAATPQMCVSSQIFLLCVVLSIRFVLQDKFEVSDCMFLGCDLRNKMSFDVTYGKIQWI